MPLLWNATTDAIVATRIDTLSTFFQRAVGLLTRSSMRPDEGVWITPCRAIHTIGMHFPIDVIFVDVADRVADIIADVRPNRLALGCARARGVIELGSGALREIDLQIGDRLELISSYLERRKAV